MKGSLIARRLGSAVRRRREALDLGQAEIARKLQMSRLYYDSIECGERNVSMDTLERLCRVLRVKAWELMQQAEGRSSSKSRKRAPRRSA